MRLFAALLTLCCLVLGQALAAAPLSPLRDESSGKPAVLAQQVAEGQPHQGPKKKRSKFLDKEDMKVINGTLAAIGMIFKKR
mmetsp:Transcript_24522/g.68916  ORF Transcript_24522/g.68916 Transcript_24522/m.68916 type:complete len:82 (-) Transcript_24522:56-301(-)